MREIVIRRPPPWVIALLLAFIGGQGVASAQEQAKLEVVGQASYRERIALPPQAVFSVRIEDVSLADAPAKLMAEEVRPLGRTQVPLAFKLTVPKEQVDPRHRYSLRATIHVDGQLRFASTQSYPVLSTKATGPLQVLLQSVAQAEPGLGTEAVPPSWPLTTLKAGLSLPQSFAGVLACADCAGIAHTLTLLADGTYRLRQVYLGKPAAPFLEQGRWSLSQAVAGMSPYQLKLLGPAQEPRHFLVQPAKSEKAVSETSLRQLDREGLSFTSSFNLLLRPTAALDQIDLP